MSVQSKRLTSIDALRGFDMLLIAGGGSFIFRMLNDSGWKWAQVVVKQMEHVTWNGFVFWDFYSFLFLI